MLRINSFTLVLSANLQYERKIFSFFLSFLFFREMSCP